LKTYPKGTQSLNSENTSFSYGVTDDKSGLGNAAAKQQIEAQMRERIEEILKKTNTDPAVALASALALPVHGTFESSSPRSDVLLGIAEKTAAKKASVSKSALDEFSTIQDQLTPQETTGIDRLPELYLKIGDVDGAKKAVDILVKAAAKIYEKVTDARPLTLRMSSVELLGFSVTFGVLFVFTSSWFLLGGAIGCLGIALKHRRLANSLLLA
jgi:hypothetical protein